MDEKDKPAVSGAKTRLDNYKIFRPEAVAAFTTRRAGEPWETHVRFERWIIFGLSIAAMGAGVLLLLGVR